MVFTGFVFYLFNLLGSFCFYQILFLPNETVFFPFMLLTSSIKPAKKEAPWESQCPIQPCWLTVMPSRRPVATLKVRRNLNLLFWSYFVSAIFPSIIYHFFRHGESSVGAGRRNALRHF